ncbi:MAG: FtsH protease activity modulator HflK [Geminicoccaceae bacterium]
MPWNSQGGGWQGGGGPGPWGGRPGGGQQPPDLEELLRRSQEKVKSLFPGGGPANVGGKGLILVGLAILGLWLASGIYTVQPDEQGLVTRFGQLDRTTGPGLRYHLPTPIEAVERVPVTRVNRVEVGFRSASQTATTTSRAGASRDVGDEALMLTGDENIIDINFVVLWRIGNAADYRFNVRDPENTVKAAAESVMREIIGQTPIVEATTEGRRAIELRAREQLQALMDEYGTGILIDEVQLQKADPPAEVIDSFRDVQRAQADRERAQNEAEAFANDIIPRARGEAERVLQEAQAYRQEVTARATGEAQRFKSILTEYLKAEDVTARRLYLETMEEILKSGTKVIIEGKQGTNGVVPYLPLPELDRRAPSRQQEAPSTSDNVQGAAQ